MHRLLHTSFIFALGALCACGAVPETALPGAASTQPSAPVRAATVPPQPSAATAAPQPTAAASDPIIVAAEAALQTVRFATPGTLQVDQAEGDFARVQRVPQDPNAADPSFLFLKRTNGAWKVVAGPGTAFGPEDLEPYGVPQTLWLPVAQPAMPFANSMEAALQAAMQASGSVVPGAPYLELTDGAVSRVRWEPTDPNSTDPAYFFVQQTGTNWQVVAGPGTAFQPEDMQQAGVPQPLWLGAAEEAIAKLFPANPSAPFTLDMRGIDHNYARVELVPNNGDDPATAFVRVQNGAWQIVQGVDGPHDDATLRQRGIPERLISGVPAHGGIALPSAEESLCNDTQTLIEATLKITATQIITDVQNPGSGASVLGCQITVRGTGAQFRNPSSVSQQLLHALAQQGWREDQAFQADGPIGTATGVRKDGLLGLLAVGWVPTSDANCPQDQPIDACELAPTQQDYTITLSLLAAK